MIIEGKIFFTCIIFLLATAWFAAATKKENVPHLVKLATVVLFFLSAVGIVASLLMAIWR
jgi:hypothetical protein